MDRENNGGGRSTADADAWEKESNSKPRFSQNLHKDAYVMADKIDLKKLDLQLEKHYTSSRKPKEEWEIDISKIELEFLIARGTYGTVYRALYDGNHVAVKILDWGETGIAADASASFWREVAVWHKLDHPNVTKFVGASMGTSDVNLPGHSCGVSCCQTSGRSGSLHMSTGCVVVEYLGGRTLKNYLIKNKQKKLAFKVVIQLALDLARGLSYLHSKRIVHRDVKTENILIGKQRTLKIADFGVARVEADNAEDMTGETGTLGYMAPEVIEGRPYTRKCDVYSFGICLWEMYCCEMPYPHLSFPQVLSAIARQNLRPNIPRCCPKSLASIMRRCWDANASKRPEMDEVVRLLEAINTNKGGGMIPKDQMMRGCFYFNCARGP